jgi:phage terminase large subunit-like protein
MDRFYPDQGPLRRELYRKSLEFFKAGKNHAERCILAANRYGKTEGIGAYETTLHLTGQYPDWWEGKRFDHPIKAWAAGDTSKTVREIIQPKLLGEFGAFGTGMIPGDAIVHHVAKSGVPGAVDTVWIGHASGGASTLVLKSYDQRRESFQGTEQDWIWLDEEPGEDIMTECVMRTMATGMFGGGQLILTFTPVNGWTEVVEKFLNEHEREKAGRWCITATWDDAPHLSEEEKARLFATLPPHQRDARARGIPALGSGAIYPVEESSLLVDPFEIPPHWPRAFGMDVGWNCTAALWGALDRETDVLYLYSEYWRGEGEPSVHAAAIRGRGAWIPGAIDPASRGRSQVDGRQLLQMYVDLGLDLQQADNAVEAGIYRVWTRMMTGRWKVFRPLNRWREEFRRYRRDEKGKVVKEADHLMDSGRYLEMELHNIAKVKPAKDDGPKVHEWAIDQENAGWMG